jgi:hypothetical protein
MFTPAPIDKNFVPHARRSVLPSDAGLIVHGTVSGASRAKVVPQEADCGTAAPGTICWTGPCDPSTRTRPVLRCNGSDGCTVSDTVRC